MIGSDIRRASVFVIWLRTDGYVGASSVTDVERFEREWKALSIRPEFRLVEVLRVTPTWTRELVEFIRQRRVENPHWLHGNAPGPDDED